MTAYASRRANFVSLLGAGGDAAALMAGAPSRNVSAAARVSSAATTHAATGSGVSIL